MRRRAPSLNRRRRRRSAAAVPPSALRRIIHPPTHPRACLPAPARSYPYNLDFDYGPLEGLQKYCINNLGDPFIESNYGVHSREFEIGVLQWFARLWEIEADDFWGYITNCGTGARGLTRDVTCEAAGVEGCQGSAGVRALPEAAARCAAPYVPASTAPRAAQHQHHPHPCPAPALACRGQPARHPGGP